MPTHAGVTGRLQGVCKFSAWLILLDRGLWLDFKPLKLYLFLSI